MYTIVHEFSETELNASRCTARRACLNLAQSLASSDSGTDRVISRCRKAERTRLVREHFLSP